MACRRSRTTRAISAALRNPILFFSSLILVFAAGFAFAEEPLAESSVAAQEAASADEAGDSTEKAPATDASQVGPEQPRNMSGMSILGNEEAPKALVIVPWKSSELGADLDLSDTLDDRARPVDREVFMRELRYYDLRSGARDGGGSK